MGRIQSLQLEMLKALEFKDIHGEKVVADLLAHQELWRGVMIKFKWKLEKNVTVKEAWELWNLFILTKPGQEDALRRLAETWNPGEIRFSGEKEHWEDSEDEPFITTEAAVEQNPRLYLELFWQSAPRRTLGGGSL
jgi:hypothetical protein